MAIVLTLAGVLGGGVYLKLESNKTEVRSQRQRIPAPVEVATVEVGAIEQLRSFTGALEARSSSW